MAPILLGALLCAHCGVLAQDSPLDIYSPKRLISAERLYPLERRGGSPSGGASSGGSGGGGNMGSSFIRFGRASDSAVNQPHTRSDVIIRYGRDGSFGGRLNRLRQERARRLARLAMICAASQENDSAPSSTEERIIREICRDAPAHPTVPDFV
ncbi:hypothetical protein QAD02_011241 [Eretmocerus hayati]|uniref:Uncharacterized protein n=1 Tax=Eretmocerus hayati TaxID=131215 RepID=A0ACC2NW74_9HYME|nr:hypothetical protein QAD02_011241 [Eretmocerus hayati]